MDFLQEMKKYMNQWNMIEKKDTLLVGVSGGADSVCLLSCLVKLQKEYDLKLLVVHVNHGIRGETAELDQNFVEDLCGKLGVKCISVFCDVPKLSKEEHLTLEEAGRKARYMCFKKIKEEYDIDRVAIAHNKNDQAETVLFHMFRGSALKGMTGIRPVSGGYIRPLLFAKREDILRYLREISQEYREDESNESLDYARNKIRHGILSAATQVNQGATEHIARLADHLFWVEEFLEGISREEYEKAVRTDRAGEEEDSGVGKAAARIAADSGVGKVAEEEMAETEPIVADSGKNEAAEIYLSVEHLKKMPRLIADRVMMKAVENLSGCRKDWSEKHLEQLWNLVSGENGAHLDLPYRLCAKLEYDSICIYRNETEEFSYYREFFKPPAEEKIELPIGTLTIKVKDFCGNFNEIPKKNYTKWFDYDMIKNVLQIRTRENGDYMTIDSHGHRKKLKDIWIDEKLPVRLRSQKLLLAEGHHILWILGGRISEAVKVSETTKRIMICELHTKEER